MVLSEGAVASGAACHKIPRTSPGVGYALTEDGDVTRIRCGYVPDDMIRLLAALFPAPAHPHPTSRTRTRSRAETADPHHQEPIMTSTETHTQTAAAEIPDLVNLSGRAVAGLVELLDHCHAFLDTYPTARVELGDYCTGQPAVVTSSWVFDQLGWHALLLRLQLAEATDEGRRA